MIFHVFAVHITYIFKKKIEIFVKVGVLHGYMLLLCCQGG